MELDDLRRQWRQPEPAPPPALTSQQLTALLKGRTLGLVEKMRRNARLETGANALIGLGLLGALLYVRDGFVQLGASLMLVIALVLAGYYYRVLGVLRRMSEPAASVRGHLAALAAGLRHQLRFYYRLSVAAGPVSMVLLYGFMLWQFASQGKLQRWPKTVLIVGLFLLVGVITQLLVMRVARQYVQRLYGQHLDRLEGQLRELDESAPA